MGSPSIASALDRAVRAARRADNAERQAIRHELLATEGTDGRGPLHLHLAAMHRRNQRRHRTAVMLHCHHANRLWQRINREPEVQRPLLAAVADSAGVRSATISLVGTGRCEVLVAASDPVAEAAHGLEWTLGEGPGQDIVTEQRPLRVTGAELCARWPLFGPAITELGVRTVMGAPLAPMSTMLGSLTVFDLSADTTTYNDSELVVLADALACAVFGGPDRTDVDNGCLLPPLLDEAVDHAVVYQATGMVAAQCGCTVTDALALIRAHAYTVSMSLDQLAEQIVDRKIRLGDTLPDGI